MPVVTGNNYSNTHVAVVQPTILEISDLRASGSTTIDTRTLQTARLPKGGHNTLHLLCQLSGGGQYQHLQMGVTHTRILSSTSATGELYRVAMCSI